MRYVMQCRETGRGNSGLGWGSRSWPRSWSRSWFTMFVSVLPVSLAQTLASVLVSLFLVTTGRDTSSQGLEPSTPQSS